MRQATADDALQGLVREHDALRRVATLVARQPSMTEVFETVTRETGLLFGARMTGLLRVESPTSAVMVAGWSRDAQRPPVGSRVALGLGEAAMLNAASAGGYALPAVNVTSSETLNGAMRGIVQMTTGAAAFLSGAAGDMALGARPLLGELLLPSDEGHRLVAQARTAAAELGMPGTARSRTPS